MMTNLAVRKRGVIAIWLIFLYILCMALVMSSLSGSLFQTKLIKIEKPIRVQDTNNQRTGIVALPLAAPPIRKFSSSSAETEPDYEGMFTNIDAEIDARVASAMKEVQDKDPEYYSLDEVLAWYNLLNEGANLKMLFKYSQFDEDQIEQLKNKLNSDKTELENEIKTLKSKIEDTTPKNIAEEKRINLQMLMDNSYFINSTLEYLSLIERSPEIVPYILEVENFNNFFSPIKTLLSVISLGTLTDHFWSYPRPILKLNLILSMGILGSLIFVTMEYIQDPSKHSVEMYLFRPFLGMIVALAMYVMIKSGQSTLSRYSELSPLDSELSPFFISFLGIISGMLAEEAYRRISFTGSSLFNAGTSNDTSGTSINNATTNASNIGSNVTEEQTNPKPKEQ